MPYQSKAQARFLHARKPEGVDLSEWDRATKHKKGGFAKLPERVSKASSDGKKARQAAGGAALAAPASYVGWHGGGQALGTASSHVVPHVRRAIENSSVGIHDREIPRAIKTINRAHRAGAVLGATAVGAGAYKLGSDAIRNRQRRRVRKAGHWSDNLAAHHQAKVDYHQGQLDRLAGFKTRAQVKGVQVGAKVAVKQGGKALQRLGGTQGAQRVKADLASPFGKKRNDVKTMTGPQLRRRRNKGVAEALTGSAAVTLSPAAFVGAENEKRRNEGRILRGREVLRQRHGFGEQTYPMPTNPRRNLSHMPSGEWVARGSKAHQAMGHRMAVAERIAGKTKQLGQIKREVQLGRAKRVGLLAAGGAALVGGAAAMIRGGYRADTASHEILAREKANRLNRRANQINAARGGTRQYKRSADGEFSKAVGRKDTLHFSQARDSAAADAPDWSASHPHEPMTAVAAERSRRYTSRSAKALGSYQTTQTHMRPGGPNPADRPIGHLVSRYRPIYTRKRAYVAGAGLAAGVTGAALLHHRLHKRLPGEKRPEAFARHQKQAAGAITAAAAVPALMALRSGRAASVAMSEGNTALHAAHAGRQLGHAATATALGGIAGATGALPVPKRVLSVNFRRNEKPKTKSTGIKAARWSEPDEVFKRRRHRSLHRIEYARPDTDKHTERKGAKTPPQFERGISKRSYVDSVDKKRPPGEASRDTAAGVGAVGTGAAYQAGGYAGVHRYTLKHDNVQVPRGVSRAKFDRVIGRHQRAHGVGGPPKYPLGRKVALVTGQGPMQNVKANRSWPTKIEGAHGPAKVPGAIPRRVLGFTHGGKTGLATGAVTIAAGGVAGYKGIEAHQRKKGVIKVEAAVSKMGDKTRRHAASLVGTGALLGGAETADRGVSALVHQRRATGLTRQASAAQAQVKTGKLNLRAAQGARPKTGGIHLPHVPGAGGNPEAAARHAASVGAATGARNAARAGAALQGAKATHNFKVAGAAGGLTAAAALGAHALKPKKPFAKKLTDRQSDNLALTGAGTALGGTALLGAGKQVRQNTMRVAGTHALKGNYNAALGHGVKGLKTVSALERTGAAGLGAGALATGYALTQRKRIKKDDGADAWGVMREDIGKASASDVVKAEGFERPQPQFFEAERFVGGDPGYVFRDPGIADFVTSPQVSTAVYRAVASRHQGQIAKDYYYAPAPARRRLSAEDHPVAVAGGAGFAGGLSAAAAPKVLRRAKQYAPRVKTAAQAARTALKTK